MKTLFSLFAAAALVSMMALVGCEGKPGTEPQPNPYPITGTTGSLAWELTEAGTLTISGEGAMPDYAAASATRANAATAVDINADIATRAAGAAPWSAYSAEIKVVVIVEGVTSVGDNAFAGLEVLVKVTLPDSVENIGDGAFAGCEVLVEITIPEDAGIGDGAFDGCDKLPEGTIPVPDDVLALIPDPAFRAYCEAAMENGVYETPAWDTDGDGKLSLEEAAAAEMIDASTKQIASLEGIEYFTGLTLLRCYDNQLTSLDISKNTALTTLWCFGNQLTSLDISKNTALTTLSCSGNPGDGTSRFPVKAWFDNGSIPETKNEFGNYIWPVAGWHNWKYNGATITVDYGGEIPPLYPLTGTTGGFDWILTEDGILSIGGEGETTEFPALRTRTDIVPLFHTVIIEEGVTGIGNSEYVFFPSHISDVILPESLESIGDSAFGGCTGLTEIIIPDNVTSIGDNAFAGCTGLTEIIIPDNVTSIGDNAFWGCTGLTEIIILDNVTSIGDNAFWGCTGLTEIIIPDNVTSIGDNAFNRCGNLSKVVIGDGVKHIGETTFWECHKITDLTIGNSVERIERVTFDCASLESVTIPASVKYLGGEAFTVRCRPTSVTVMATIPPMIDNVTLVFDHYDEDGNIVYIVLHVPLFFNENDTLYVPKGCVEVYKADPAWSFAFTSPDGTVNIVEQP